MRVNNDTKAYIRSCVLNKAKPLLEEIEKELSSLSSKSKYDADKEACRKELAALKELTVNRVNAILKKYKFRDSYNRELNKTAVSFNYTDLDIYLGYDDKEVGLRKRRDEIHNRIDSSVIEIVGILNLGGGRKELEKLVSEIKF